MSSYKLHTKETAPKGSKELLQGAEQQLGFIPNLYGIMSESPVALIAYNSISQNFEKSSLTSTEQQIVLLSTSITNECHYCVAVHSTVAQMYKIDDTIINSIRNGEPITDSKLEALRKFTQTVVEKRGWVLDPDVEEFISAGYSKAQMFEVIVGITQKTLSNYINHIVKTPPDAAFEKNKWENIKVSINV
jgi:uncharacterized peroxidase-related enzyme